MKVSCTKRFQWSVQWNGNVCLDNRTWKFWVNGEAWHSFIKRQYNVHPKPFPTAVGIVINPISRTNSIWIDFVKWRIDSKKWKYEWQCKCSSHKFIDQFQIESPNSCWILWNRKNNRKGKLRSCEISPTQSYKEWGKLLSAIRLKGKQFKLKCE